MGRLYYFAYGSNLHPVRFRRRVPSAGVLGRARLRGYRLRFHKFGRDQSGKCDAVRTGRQSDLVFGVVYRIARADQRALDRAEDAGRGYDRVRVWVSVGARRRIVFTYLARPEAIADGLKPYGWYLDYVLSGARHQGLPGRYVAKLRMVKIARDQDTARLHLNRRVLVGRAPPYRQR